MAAVRPPGRSGTARPVVRDACCRPTGRRAAARAARAARTALELGEQALEAAPHARRRQPGVGRRAQLRAEAPHPVELGQVTARRVLLRQPADVVVVVEPEAGAPCRCSAASPRPSRSSKSRARGAVRISSSARNGVSSFAPDAASTAGTRSAWPRPARRARAPRPRTCRRGALALRLHEHAPPVGQLDLEGLVDVAAASGRAPTTATRSAAASDASRPRRPASAAPCARRRWSSRPRQARSQMSNTSSKPRGPP